NALDEGIDREHFDAIPLVFDDRRVITDADEHPGRGWREAGLNTSDELALGEGGNRDVFLGARGVELFPHPATRHPPAPALFPLVDSTGLAVDGDLDLARLFELVFNPPRDVLGEPHRLFVGNLLALDHDPDLTSCLERERLRHAFERVGNPFELLETFD